MTKLDKIFDEFEAEKINVKTDTLESVENSELIIRYAWGNQKLKTWFITKHRFCGFEGSRLLMKLGCKKTKDDVSVDTTFPSVGDVVTDTDGDVIEIIESNWI